MASVVVLADQFPALSETFVGAEARELARQGCRVRVEATGRPRTPDPGQAAGLDVALVADDTTVGRLRDLAWLVRRAPRACARDLRVRRRWRREEDVLPLRAIAPVARRVDLWGATHLHAHFAAGAALTAMRLGAILELPWSVTAHGYDIFSRPANLAEKLERASFATSGSRFTVDALRRVAPEARVELVVMGVDGERWRRRTAVPEAGPVLAVGRLVEKKGFATLVDAAALLRGRPGFRGVRILGDGPLRVALEARAAALGVQDVVAVEGVASPPAVRDALETAAVLCVPSVVAPDGDADSMPVVAKEALAMEVPVVASDVAGLPEVVDASCGRLAAPGDPVALAEALAEVLALPSGARAALGAAGRERCTGELGLARQTARLVGLIGGAAGGDSGSRLAPPRPRH